MGSSFIHLIRTDWNEFFFNGWVIFHSVYVPQLPYPFICWWASRLLPCPGYYKQLHSAFFIVQLSHPYMTTGKAIALTRRTFVGKVMSLLFNMLSRLVIVFLPRSSSEITKNTTEVKYRHKLMSKILILNFKPEWISSQHTDRQL